MKLKAARETSGKTQAQVAKEVGITERGYRKLEAKEEYKAVDTAIRIARVLNSTVEELFGAEILKDERKQKGNSNERKI